MGLKIGRDRHCLEMMEAVGDCWKSSFSPLTFPRVLVEIQSGRMTERG